MKLLSMDDVAECLGVSVASVRRMMDRGEFISPIQVSPRRVGFDENEVTAWLANRPRGKLQQPAQLVASDLV